MATPAATDRRVQRTRKLLRDALLALIFERGWDAVTVQTICERANVGRSTFYSHFADKEELLLSGFDDLKKMLSGLRAASGDAIGFSRALFEHAGENRRLFRALLGKRSGQVVQRRFRDVVVELTRDELEASGVAGAGREAVVRYLAGAFTDLLIWSLDHARPYDPAELDRLFQQLSAPVVARARRL